MKKAFTLIEIMIVAGIIGLLAGMATPVFRKIKVNTIAKEVASGQTVTNAQYRYLKENISWVHDDIRYRLPADITGNPSATQTIINVPVENFQIIVINGKIYKLVPQ